MTLITKNIKQIFRFVKHNLVVGKYAFGKFGLGNRKESIEVLNGIHIVAFVLSGDDVTGPDIKANRTGWSIYIFTGSTF